MTRDKDTELMLSVLVHNQTLFHEIMTKIQKRIFEQDDYDTFVGHLRRYHDKYKTSPTMDEFRIFVGNVTFNTYPYGAEIFMMKPQVDLAFIKDRFYQAYQTQQTMLLVDTIQDKVEDNVLDVQELYTDMRELVRSTLPSVADYTEIGPDNYLAEYHRAREFRTEGLSPLCFKNVNRVTGGIGVREMLIFLAPASRGKTLYLVNEMYGGLMNDEKVLYCSMENEKETIISRLSNRVLLMTTENQRVQDGYCRSLLNKFWMSVRSPVIMYRPAGSFSVDDLELFVDEYEMRTGERFDRIIVDYLNKFKKVRPNKNSQEFDDIRRLSDDFRAMVIQKNSRGITAAQTNRAGIANREGTATESTNEAMIQGGFGQYETADMVLGYSETPNEQQRGEGRVAILKSREGGGRGREFVVSTAPWIGLITDSTNDVINRQKQDELLKNPYRDAGVVGGLKATSDIVKKKRRKRRAVGMTITQYLLNRVLNKGVCMGTVELKLSDKVVRLAAVCHVCAKQIVHEEVHIVDDTGRFFKRLFPVSKSFALCEEHEHTRKVVAKASMEVVD